MSAGSEFHTEGTATLKPREAKVVCVDTRVLFYSPYETNVCGSKGGEFEGIGSV